MALSFVGGKAIAFAGATTNQIVSLTDLSGGSNSAPQPGDIVIAVYGTSRNSGSDPGHAIVSAGYAENERYFAVTAQQDIGLVMAWKVMGVTPDTQIEVTGSQDGTYASALAVHVWRGAHQTMPFVQAETRSSGTGNSRPNPPSIVPAQGSTQVLAAGVGVTSGSMAALVAGTLSNFRTAFATDSIDCAIGLGSIAYTGAAIDPPVWTGGTANAGDSWGAMCAVLMPSSIAFAMPANGGSHAASGAAATLRKALRLTAAAGTVSLNGASAGLERGFRIVAGAGGHALAGADAALGKALHVIGAVGALAVTGAGASFRIGYRFIAGAGEFRFSGEDAALQGDFNLFTSDAPDPSRILILGPIERNEVLSARPPRTAVVAASASRTIVISPLRRDRTA
jgi:hypothetical protein